MLRTQPEHRVDSKVSNPHLPSARGDPDLFACISIEQGYGPVCD